VTEVDVRCPVDPRTLFLRIGQPDVTVDGTNTLTVACDSCRARYRKLGDPVRLVKHSYNVLGEHLGTEVVR
jgi:hypothetical protein